MFSKHVQFRKNCHQNNYFNEAIRVDIKTELFNTKQTIFVCIKGKNDLPIVQIETPLKISEIEEKASKLASFLKVPVKGI